MRCHYRSFMVHLPPTSLRPIAPTAQMKYLGINLFLQYLINILCF